MRLRRRISEFRIQNSALILALVALGIAAILILRPSDDRSLQHIRDLGVLRIGIDPSFPPFESLDANGQIVGFDADLAAALARRWGVRVQFESIGFDGLLDAIWAGRVDAVISALPLEPRYTRDIAYSQPYFEAGLHLVATTTRITSSADLTGRTLALELGSDADAEARRLRQRIPALTIVTFATPAEALQAVLDGAADAAVVDGVTGLLMPNRDPNAWAAALDGLIEHPLRLAAMSAAAAERGRGYTWSTTAARLRRVYSDLSRSRVPATCGVVG